MLIDLHNPDLSGAEIRIGDVKSNSPFKAGLEYSCPSRGTWTIAHTPMLIPGSYMIYVGASACLRGVVLSVAEYEGLDRFSMIMIEEKNILSGNMEELFIEGISDILKKLEKKPTVVMPFTGCIHEFLATDMDYVYEELRRRFPDIDFISCKMNPAMQENEATPDELIIRSIYQAVSPFEEKDEKSVNVIGSYLPMSRKSDFMKMLSQNDYTVKDLCRIQDYDEYKEMGKSILNIYSLPVAKPAALDMKERLNQDSFFLPYTYDFEEIENGMKELSKQLGLKFFDLTLAKEQAVKALAHAKEKLVDTPIVIDYVSSLNYFGMAKLLLENGFNVTKIYGDKILPGNDNALKWVQKNYPDLPLRATAHYNSRFFERNEAENYDGKLLAIGPKAAYFSGTKHFVNMIQNDGVYGFASIEDLANKMISAMEKEIAPKEIIEVKGWGCLA